MERINLSSTRRNAVLRHINQNPEDVGSDVAKQIVSNPDLVKDVGLRHTGFETSITTYKRMLYLQGVPPLDILRGVDAVRDRISKRNGKAQFIESMQSVSEALVANNPAEEAVTNQPTQMKEGVELKLA